MSSIRVNKESCYRCKQQTKTDSLGEEKFHSAPESLSSDETTSPVATTPPTGAVVELHCQSQLQSAVVSQRGRRNRGKK